KQSWQLTLHVPKDQVVLSNTPVLSETEEPGGMKAVRFAETKPLPSYLVALAVGPFESVDARRARKERRSGSSLRAEGQGRSIMPPRPHHRSWVCSSATSGSPTPPTSSICWWCGVSPGDGEPRARDLWRARISGPPRGA